MNTAATKILFHLTGEKEIEKVPLETLQKLVEENPYFPLTQFFLVKKLKEEKSENYLAQLQKSALFFTNPHWLNFQLKNIDHPIKIVEEQKAEEIITPIEPTQDKVIIIEADETEKSFEIETPIVEDFELLENIEPIVEEKSVPGVEANIEQNEEIAESIEIKNNIENIAEKQPQELLVPSVAETATITNAEIDLIEEEKEEVIAPQKKIAEETQATNEEIFTTTEKIKEEKIDSLVDEHEQMFQNIKALLDSTTAEANADTGNAIVPIDPYHTIDYFASQGIHVDFDKNPDDKLGKNLKKFTQWLRHMKKLGPEDAIETNVEAEAEIQQIANSSNIMKEIVTEAMAQVLEKQGKKDKAIELYNKLSFLYPHKIPYFADQIKKLKGD